MAYPPRLTALCSASKRIEVLLFATVLLVQAVALFLPTLAKPGARWATRLSCAKYDDSLPQHGNARVDDRRADAQISQRCVGLRDAKVTHRVGILSHGGFQRATLQQAENRVRLVEADTDDGLAGCLDGIAYADRRTFIGTIQANQIAVTGDEAGSGFLRSGRIAVLVRIGSADADDTGLSIGLSGRIEFIDLRPASQGASVAMAGTSATESK